MGELEKGGAPLGALGATHQRPGTVIGGGYRIIELLSEGGMGAVYVAEQLSIQRRRALKLMQTHLVGSERLRERFMQEARIGSRIASEHVVEVIDSGVDGPTGVPWLAMELLDGETLGDRCDRGPLSVHEWTGVLTQACHAVGAAHRAGIVHRDLKPENVFLAKARLAGVAHTVKVLDFGIAKLVSENALAATQAIGTPLYMPPEQMEDGGDITPGADVWSLALIAFYALTGKSYWRAGNVEDATPLMILKEIGHEPIVPPTVRAAELGVPHLVPAGFDAWFMGAVDRRIAARYKDADALAVAWRAVEAGARRASLANLNATIAASPMDLEALARAAEAESLDATTKTDFPDASAPEPGVEEAAPATVATKKKKKKRKKKVEPESAAAEPARAETRIPAWQPKAPDVEKKPFNTALLVPIGLVAIAIIVAIAKC